jgi:hypothetical protein
MTVGWIFLETVRCDFWVLMGEIFGVLMSVIFGVLMSVILNKKNKIGAVCGGEIGLGLTLV